MESRKLLTERKALQKEVLWESKSTDQATSGVSKLRNRGEDLRGLAE